MDSLDSLIRTVAGEASGDPRERQAIAAAIINRARVQGKTIDQIIKQPGQFESWSNPKSRARMLALDPQSSNYQAIRSAVEPIYSGAAPDPTNGATHFYAPKAQASLGRNAPSWDDGKGADIGQSRFFNKGAPTANDSFDSLSDVGPSATAPSQDAPVGAPKAFDFESIADQAPKAGPGDEADLTRPDLSQGLQPFLQRGDKKGAMAYLAANSASSINDPTLSAQVDNAIKYHGAMVVQAAGKIPAPSNTMAGALGAGGIMGVRDVLEGTVGKGLAAVEDKVPLLRSADNAISGLTGQPTTYDSAHDYDRQNALFNAIYNKDIPASVGRIGGNIVASAPFMAAGGAVAGAGARALGVSEPAMSFLAGNAGRAVAANEAAGTAAQGGNMLLRGASLGVNGAAQGAEAAALTSGQNDAPLADQMATGATLGGVLGPVGGVVGGITSRLTGAVAPKMSQGTAQLADLAMNKYGIDLRGSQITPNMLIRRWDAQHANGLLSDFGEQNAMQRGQFTRAVGQTFGADAEHLTPEVMNAAKGKIGSVYNDVATRTNLDVNPESGSPFVDNISNIVANAKGTLDTTHAAPLNNLVTNILDKVGENGTISGSAFKALTSKGSMLDGATASANPTFAATAKALKAELNGALTRSAAPEDVQALKSADMQWKNMRTVEKLIASAPDGQFSPALLQSKVTGSFKNRAYTGAGDLGELGDIGQTFLKPPPSSGTAENIKAEKLFSGANALSGVGIGGLAHLMGMSPEFSMAAAAVGGGKGIASYLGNAAASKAYGNSAYANKLIQAALNDNIRSPIPTLIARNYLPPAVIASNKLVAGSQSAQ